MKRNLFWESTYSIKAMDQLKHVIKLYINLFMQDNFFNLQNIYLKC